MRAGAADPAEPPAGPVGRAPETSGERSTASKVANFVLFQAVYVACVFGARDVSPWLGVAVGAGLLPLNLLFLDRRERRRDLEVVAVAAAFGAVVDSALRGAGVLAFAPETVPHGWPGWVAPPWILCLWVALGTLVRSSLAWMGRLPVPAQSALGAASGALSFWSASRLGVTRLPLGAGSLAALGVQYGLIVPILLRIAQTPSASPPERSGTEPSAADETR